MLKRFLSEIPLFNIICTTAASYSRSTTFRAFNEKEHFHRLTISTYTDIRWNSFFKVTKDLVLFKDQLIRFHSKNPTSTTLDVKIFAICEMLEPLADCVGDIVKILQAEKFNPISFVLYFFKELKNSIASLDNHLNDAKKEFFLAYNEYWEKHKKCWEIPLGIATRLNPFLDFLEVTDDRDYQRDVDRKITSELNRLAPPVMNNVGTGRFAKIFQNKTRENEFEL